MRFLRFRESRGAAPCAAHDSASVVVPTVGSHRLRSASWYARILWQWSSSLRSSSCRCCVSCFALLGQRVQRWYHWLKRCRLLWYAVAALLLLLITLTLTVILFIALTWNHPWTQLHVEGWLRDLTVSRFSAVVPGNVHPREPERLWGLTVRSPEALSVEPVVNNSRGGRTSETDAAARQERLAARLLDLHGAMLLLYTFVNGSEANHVYRRLALTTCGDYIRNIEFQLALNGVVTDGKGTTEICTTSIHRAKTNAEVRKMVARRASATVTSRDRETDELRHSLRSVEQHVRWHRGRVVMVSPGHHPTWVDGAKNFLAGMCGDARVQALRSNGTHLRVTTVHQDAVIPTHARLTVNTNVIEQHLWRVRNVTSVHVYMNDDYFVNRDVAITDLLNEYGGTIVRTESAAIAGAKTGKAGLMTWAEGVLGTNFFVTDELDLKHEDEVPAAVVRLWQQQDDALTLWDVEAVREGKAPLPAVKAPDPRNTIFIMLDYAETSPPRSIAVPRVDTVDGVVAAYRSRTFGTLRPRFYATHAPFVYCTNMLRYLALRYQREFAQSMFLSRARSASDLYVPFLYNAFIMARPWQASPRFPAYITLRQQLGERQMRRASLSPSLMPAAPKTGDTGGVGVRQPHTEWPSQPAPQQVPGVSMEETRINVAPIELNNCDGCAPATMLVGPEKSECLFGAFSDDLRANDGLMRQVRQAQPLFFNVNAGLTKPKAADQLRAFLQELFPKPVFLENNAGGDAALSRLFGDLMALPVVGVVSYEEGVCPLVRSLALAFAGHHRGGVRVSVQRYGLGEVDATMAEVRQDLRYTQQSAMPAVACTYAAHVTVKKSRRGESLAALARRVLDDADKTGDSGVELPWTCSGGCAGLRVRGFLVDARTPGAPLRDMRAVATALAVPAQTLSLEDFRAVAVGPSEGDVVLVVSREDAEAKAVHWVNGASESDLLLTYPLPVEAYEDMDAEVRWVEWRPRAKATA
ncbi:hypothetical protein LMJF_16_1060 [Leishmania major strain Friedlin]|uniref:Stealth protein CR3 conserved region 3 domain-containing protein n=1 Tax=Leishmania major TaxID=5664 RepID=Q4QER2_LEIMA|nr:hypothetical protein LMJF_16_1060 [Leishmania major strain Friedlin]CAG9572144.1 Protein_of_unknown_function_(DUF3184) [Leishmania major strain Friedlin]CAJ03815.1 hypothetical protein LMJF_16_1060 [Leishmania major strain Friedlin]|eukprot:XP_001682186.1 hypothetical protein LMJF_16_1060 [Leishmania major strain Friedlin]